MFQRKSKRIVALVVMATAFTAPTFASRIIIDGPPGTGFGARVTVLPNGNFVVGSDTGALHLYRADGTLISLLNNLSSQQKPVALGDNAFLVVNPTWNNGAGAVTRVDASTGLTVPVSAANSIIGASAGDRVGEGGIVVLANGDYVVHSPSVKIGTATRAGAVTRVSAASPVYGVVSAANSLVGTQTDDFVGAASVVKLANGNYVVASPSWANGSATRAGAVTWCSGTGSCIGPVSTANSLVGSQPNDEVGVVTSLSNGNYVVSSPYWGRGAARGAGAVTWVSGATGITGVVSTANSLVGATEFDNVGLHVTALRNGNYVVGSPQWDRGGIRNAGAVTWGSGNGGLVGEVTATNSLVGATMNDTLGGRFLESGDFLRGDAVVPLDNGHYVVNAAFWSNGSALHVGAVFRANGNGGTTGSISPANALVGTNGGDRVGLGGVWKLTNGHYVVASDEWKNGTVERAGASTWCNADGSTVGPVSAANSLVGASAMDLTPGSVIALTNGHYVVSTPRWRAAGMADVGAVTWGNGNGGTAGTISMLNSIVGTNAVDIVGQKLAALKDGSYLFSSYGADSFGLSDNGAVTRMTGNGPAFGALPLSRSLVGASSGDRVGNGGLATFSDGNYAVFTDAWDAGSSIDVGATTLLPGNSAIREMPQAWNSEFGLEPQAGNASDYDYDPINQQLIVGRVVDNRVTMIRQERILADGFD